MKTYRLAHNLSLIDVAPPISGFDKFIGVYVLEGEKIALIDVGPTVSVANLVSGLTELKIDPADISYIFVTHIHLDHAGGIGTAVKQMPDARVVVQGKGGPHLADPTRLWQDSQRALGELALQYQLMEPVPQDRIIIAESGMLFDLGGTELQVLETPGHASHHLSLLDIKEGRLFAGEAAGVYIEEIDLVRPTTPTPFNLEQSLSSLDELIRLAPISLYYAHFGPAADTLGRLQHYKQQLILWGSLIADCRERDVSYQEMYHEIRKKDGALARIDRLPPYQRDRELYFINSSIRGFASYFERYGNEYIEQLRR